MKYHINKNLEAGECKAENLSDCPYYNTFGSSNHYDNEYEAREIAKLIRAGKYSMFATSRACVQDALQQINAAPESKRLPKINNPEDIINKLFNGNEKSYKEFMKMYDGNNIAQSTRVDLAKMLTEGLKVQVVDDVDEATDTDDESNVTLLSEKTTGMKIPHK